MPLLLSRRILETAWILHAGLTPGCAAAAVAASLERQLACCPETLSLPLLLCWFGVHAARRVLCAAGRRSRGGGGSWERCGPAAARCDRQRCRRAARTVLCQGCAGAGLRRLLVVIQHKALHTGETLHFVGLGGHVRRRARLRPGCRPQNAHVCMQPKSLRRVLSYLCGRLTQGQLHVVLGHSVG